MPPSARLVGIGFYIGLCIALGTVGGSELDEALNTGRLFTLLGLALGLILALVGGTRQLMDVLTEIRLRDSRRKRD